VRYAHRIFNSYEQLILIDNSVRCNFFKCLCSYSAGSKEESQRIQIAEGARGGGKKARGTGKIAD
jgi:hypothetical protein